MKKIKKYIDTILRIDEDNCIDQYHYKNFNNQRIVIKRLINFNHYGLLLRIKKYNDNK